MGKFDGFEIITGSVSNSETELGMWSWLIIISLVILFIIVAIINIIIDIADAGADAASVGTVGVFTGVVDFISECVLQAIQEGCIIIIMIVVGSGSFLMNTLKIIALTCLAAIDIIMSAIAIVVPYLDIVETAVEFITDTIESFILGGTVKSVLGK